MTKINEDTLSLEDIAAGYMTLDEFLKKIEIAHPEIKAEMDRIRAQWNINIQLKD
jgi:hypothetical protein